MNKPIAIPTVAAPGTMEKLSNYVKAEYTLLVNEKMPCTNNNVLSPEQAAELGAEYFWDVFKLDLSGKTVYMSFAVDPSRSISYCMGIFMKMGLKL